MIPSATEDAASDRRGGGTSRLTTAEALQMYRDLSIHELGRRAHAVTMRLHPEPYRTYVVDRNINYSNWCTAKCIFCNFKADPPGRRRSRAGLPAGYVLDLDELGRKIQELIDIGGTQVLLQGGLAPADVLGLDWYLDMLRFIRRQFPSIHIHAFSPPEIFAFHQMFGLSIRDVLLRLRDAGLDTIPGGGAEILVDRVRDIISRGKTRTDEYLEVMRQAHRIGMRTTITMMFGHIETMAERIEHLQRVRDLQDETGGFTAFIPWTFQPGNTRLAGSVAPVEGIEYLRTQAASRLILDNVPHHQASRLTQGARLAGIALYFGADDFGSVMMEENVVAAAGAKNTTSEKEMRRIIEGAGFKPVKRLSLYQNILHG